MTLKIRPGSSTPVLPPASTPLKGNTEPAAPAPAPPSVEKPVAHQRTLVREFAEGSTVPPVKGATNALSLRASQAADRLDGTGGKASGRANALADGARGTFSSGVTLTNPPGVPSAPKPADKNSAGLTRDPHGLSGDVTRTGEEASHSVGGALERGNLSVSVSHARDGSSVSGGISAERDYVDVSVSRTVATEDGGARALSGFVGVTPGSVLVGGRVRTADAAGTGLSIGGFVGVSADRSVGDLGDYAGEDPALAGTRKLQLKKSAGNSGALSGGVVTSMLPIGGRLALSRSTAVTYTTHLPPEQARAVLHEGGGAIRFFQDKARALGLAKDIVEVPSLERPESLKVGDTLSVATTGSVSAGAVVGSLGLRTGVQALMRGEFQVSVQKLEDSVVELTVVPTDVRGMQVFADSSVVLEMGVSRTQAASLAQSFRIDLSRPEGRAAYQAALKGELPNGLNKARDAEGDLAALIRDEELPDGVVRTYLERAELTQHTAGGGLNWGIIQERTTLAGLSFHRTRSVEKREITDGAATLAVETRGVSSRREVLISGTESHGISAGLRRVTTYADDGASRTEFAGLRLHAHFSDERVRGLELNSEVVDQLNQALDAGVAALERAGRNHERTVDVERTLTAADLEALGKHPPLHVADMARAAGVSEPALQELVRSVREAADADARAMVVQEFVAKRGLAGFGAVHRLVGGGREALAIQSSSSAYTEPVETARSLAFKYNQPISANDDAKTLTERHAAVTKALEKAEKSLEDLAADTLLPADVREQSRAPLQDAVTQLRALMGVDHLSAADRRRLHAELDAGWTTAAEYRLMAHLQQAGLG